MKSLFGVFLLIQCHFHLKLIEQRDPFALCCKIRERGCCAGNVFKRERVTVCSSVDYQQQDRGKW